MRKLASLSLFVVSFLHLPAGASGQVAIQAGPEISGLSGSDAVISIRLSVAAPAEIQYWTDPSAGIRTIQRPSNDVQTFPIPATPLQYYRIIVRNADGTEAIRTQQFSTLAANLPSAAIKIDSATVINGNILNVPVDATRRAELAVSWVSWDGSGGSANKPIEPGHNEVQIGLPAPPSGSKIVRVTLRASSSGQVVAEQPSTPYAVSPSTAQFAVGGGTAVPSLSGAKLTVPITSAVLQRIDYALTLKNSGFERTIPGSCSVPSCEIQVSGLAPGTKYTYSVQFTAGGETKPYVSVSPLEFETLKQAELTGGPKLEFTTTGFQVLAVTTEDATAELVYKDLHGNTITSPQTMLGTRHVIPVAQGLVFDSAGTAETSLQLVLRNAAGTEILRSPFGFKMAMNPVTTPAAAKTLGNRRIRDIISAVGPAALAFLGVPATLVDALRQ